MAEKKTSYVCKVTAEQSDELRTLLETRGWSLDALAYARWRARCEKTMVVSYESGKLVVQGAGTEEFVLFLLEPEILHEARLGYEKELAPMEKRDMFEPHAGIDESGKGDFFGPLVIACCYTEGTVAKRLLEAGVADSKTIHTDQQIHVLANLIRQETAGRYSVIAVGPEAYNRMYGNIGNLNRLLAWGHAKALETLLEKVPDCPRAISDQFAATHQTVRTALQERGRKILLEQYPRAEADIAVAAASILARDEFVRRMVTLSQTAGVMLPRGAGLQVQSLARELAQKLGADGLSKIAKMHFKTATEALRPSSGV